MNIIKILNIIGIILKIIYFLVIVFFFFYGMYQILQMD